MNELKVGIGVIGSYTYFSSTISGSSLSSLFSSIQQHKKASHIHIQRVRVNMILVFGWFVCFVCRMLWIACEL
jgi:hypothetical protein